MNKLIKIILTSLLLIMVTTFSTAQQALWGTATGGGGGATDLATVLSATGALITSSTGTDAALPGATATDAGLLTAADKVILDSIVPAEIVWDAEINMATSTQPCVDVNNAIATAMQAGVSKITKIRVHMGTADFFDVAVETDYEDIGPYKACIALYPTLDATNGYPVPANTANWITGVNGNANTRFYLFFDNIVPHIDQRGMTENGVFLDAGNGFMAGHGDNTPPAVNNGKFWGRLSEHVRIGGNILARNRWPNDAGWDDRRLPVGGPVAKLNALQASAHAMLAAQAATYSDMSELRIQISEQDDDDILAQISNSWGIALPALQTTGSQNEGVGVIFHGINSTEPNQRMSLRQMDYGIVFGDPAYGGWTSYYASCAAATTPGAGGTPADPEAFGGCSPDVRHVRGTTVEGINEGHTYALFVDIGSEAQNQVNTFMECGGTSCLYAGVILQPWFCDGTTGTGTVKPSNIPASRINAECSSNNDGGVTMGGPSGVTQPTEDGVIRFGGRNVPIGGITSPSVLLGQGFIKNKSVYFGQGTSIGNSGEPDNFLFSPHYDLMRPNVENCTAALVPYASCTGVGTGTGSAVVNLAGVVGRVDTTASTIARHDSVYPGNYDGWIDAKERLLVDFILVDPLTAGADWNAGVLPNNRCLNTQDNGVFTGFFANAGVACTSSTASKSYRWNNEMYITRMSVVATSGFNVGEACEIGISLDSYAAGAGTVIGDFHSVSQIPPMPEVMAPGETYMYPINGLLPGGDALVVSIGDGNNPPDGTTAPACLGSFTANIEIYGMPFDPIE